ncbi:hypothetical protein [Sphingomonas zeae]
MQRYAAAAVEAARRLVAGQAPAAPVSFEGPITLEGDLGPYEALLDAALAGTVPECGGYNIADPEVCAQDARWLSARLDPRAPVLVIGIRSGGSYLAPIWAAALAAATSAPISWVTVRPLGAASRREGYHPGELARLPDASRTDGRPTSQWAEIVVVDDLPDSGDTVGRLLATVRPRAARLWSASVGKVAAHPAGKGPVAARSAPQFRPRVPRPLWMCLDPADQPEFRARLEQAAPGCLPAGKIAVHIRVPTLEARYGSRTPWRAWSDPALANERRRLVNPRKTPLVVADAAGQPLLHLRFIGETPFGPSEHKRAARLAVAPVAGWFVDGYCVARHEAGLQSVRERLAGADRAAVLDGCSAQLLRLTGEPVAQARGQTRRPIGPMLLRRLALLSEEHGVPGRLPREVAWLVEAAADGRSSGSLLRSSLRHAGGAWHWQVDPAGRVRRFHLEAGWGGVSWPELEVASFALEHRLEARLLARLLAACDRVAQPEDVARSLPAAALLSLDAIHRAARRPSVVDVDRLAADIGDLLDGVTVLSELLHA